MVQLSAIALLLRGILAGPVDGRGVRRADADHRVVDRDGPAARALARPSYRGRGRPHGRAASALVVIFALRLVDARGPQPGRGRRHHHRQLDERGHPGRPQLPARRPRPAAARSRPGSRSAPPRRRRTRRSATSRCASRCCRPSTRPSRPGWSPCRAPSSERSSAAPRPCVAAQFQLVVLAGVALAMTLTGIVVTRMAGRTPYVISDHAQRPARGARRGASRGADDRGKVDTVPDLHDPTDWLLTKTERGNPSHPARRRATPATGPGPRATWSARWSTARRTSPSCTSGSRRPGTGDLVLFTDWQGDADERLDRRARQRGRRGARPRRRARGRRARPGLALALRARSASPSGENRTSASSCRPRGGRGAARHAGAHRRLAPPEARGASATATTRRATSPTSAASTCATRRRDDADAPRRPAGAATLAEEYGDTPALARRPGRDQRAGRRTTSRPSSGSAGRTRPRSPAARCIRLARPAARARHHARPAARAGAAAARRSTAAPTPSSCCAPTRTCAAAATTRSPAAASAASPAATPRRSRRARRLIYVEDQYLWGDARRRRRSPRRCAAHPDLHVIAVVPLHPDLDGGSPGCRSCVGRRRAMLDMLRAAPDRVAVYGIENHAGTPVYVHAKVCVVDDTWATIGSDNFNRRSWTHDSELSARRRGPRPATTPAGCGSTLAAEHLDRTPPTRPTCWRSWPTASSRTACSRRTPQRGRRLDELVRRRARPARARPGGCGASTRRSWAG